MAFSEEDPEVYPKVRSTIGAVVLLVNPLPPSGITELIGLDPEQVILFLTLVQSLLTLDEDFDQPVKPFHKSFPDFITDPSRCLDMRFYISPGDVHLELAGNCLRLMNNGLEQNILSLPDYALNSEVEDLQTRIKHRISVAMEYACRSWHNHITRTTGDVAGIISDVRFFLEEKFLAWLEVASVLGAVRGAVAALEQVIHWLKEVCFGPPLYHYLTLTYCETGFRERRASRHCQRLLLFCDQVFRGYKRLRHPHLPLCTGVIPSVVDRPKTVSSPTRHSLAKSGNRNPRFVETEYRPPQ